MENTLNISTLLLRSLKVPFTSKNLKLEVMGHPHMHSLLAIMDVLEKYSISNAALNLEKGKFQALDAPFVAQINHENLQFFCLIEKKDDEYVHININKKREVWPTTEFLDKWTGVTLLFEADENAKEPGYQSRIKYNRVILILTILVLSGFYSLTLLSGYYNFENTTLLKSYYAIIASHTLGALISGALLLYEVDEYNPFLKNICSGNKGNGCSEILKSKYSNLIGGKVNLSILGFSYFLASLLSLSIFPESIFLIAWLSILTIPIIIFSLGCQYFILKQWCNLCLLILGVLFADLLLIIINPVLLQSISFSSYVLFFMLFLVVLLAWLQIKPLLITEKDSFVLKRNFIKLKEDPEIFKNFLQRSRKVRGDLQELGLVFDRGANVSIIKVCNPFCGPCAKAHSVLHDFLSQNKINLQILFTASGEDSDPKTAVVKYFLHLSEERNGHEMEDILHFWYKEGARDFEKFMEKYPVGQNTRSATTENIKRMKEWCEQNEISHTPTIFINGYEIPNEYSIYDLKYLLH